MLNGIASRNYVRFVRRSTPLIFLLLVRHEVHKYGLKKSTGITLVASKLSGTLSQSPPIMHAGELLAWFFDSS